MRWLADAYTALIDGLAAVSALILIGMSLWVSYDVTLRYVFVAPTSWADDLSEYGLLWATFLAAPWVLRNGGHVRVELLVVRLSESHRRRLEVACSVLGAIVCAIFAWQTALTVIEFYMRGLMMARIWRIPLWMPYAAIPVGSSLLAMEFFLRALRIVRHGMPKTESQKV